MEMKAFQLFHCRPWFSKTVILGKEKIQFAWKLIPCSLVEAIEKIKEQFSLILNAYFPKGDIHVGLSIFFESPNESMLSIEILIILSLLALTYLHLTELSMNSMELVIPLHFISWKKTPNNAVILQPQSQFTPKMKANAVPHLLSSLVWIDQYNECNGMTSSMEFMRNAAGHVRCTEPLKGA